MNLPELLVHGTPGIVSDGTIHLHTHTHTHTYIYRLMAIALSMCSRPFGTTRLKIAPPRPYFGGSGTNCDQFCKKGSFGVLYPQAKQTHCDHTMRSDPKAITRLNNAFGTYSDVSNQNTVSIGVEEVLALGIPADDDGHATLREGQRGEHRFWN